MPSNVEIKARVRGDPRSLRRRAAELATEAPLLMRQKDTFFCTPRGRLKLRESEVGPAELIYYERANECGPRPSVYRTVPVADAPLLGSVLAACLGVRGVVSKERELFLARDTRIHLDDVALLGRFVELEVMLSCETELERGRERCRELMEALGVVEEDLVDRSYIDMLEGRSRGKPSAARRSGRPRDEE
jgi:adenylate cyclase class IV